MEVPNQPATPTHSVRVPDDLWEAAKRIAEDRGETMTSLVLRLLRREVREHGH